MQLSLHLMSRWAGAYILVMGLSGCSSDSRDRANALELVPADMDFGTVIIGQSVERRLMVVNRSSSGLPIDRIEPDDGLRELLEVGAPRGAMLPAGGTVEVILRLTLLERGLQEGRIDVFLADRVGPLVSASIRASGTEDPRPDAGTSEAGPTDSGTDPTDSGIRPGVDPEDAGVGDGGSTDDAGEGGRPCIPSVFTTPLTFPVSRTWSDHREARVAHGPGGFVMVWATDDEYGGVTDGGDVDLFYSRSENGVSWEPSRPLTGLESDPLLEERRPDLASDGRGTWMIVWQVINGALPDPAIFSARSTDGGATWGPPRLVALTPNSPGALPRVLSDGAGTWVVVWHGRDRSGLEEGDILYSRSTDGGLTWFERPRPIHASALTDDGEDRYPVIASAGEGEFMVVWESTASLNRGLGGDADTLWARSDDGANTFSAPQPLLQTAATDQIEDGAPDVISDGAGYVAAIQTQDGARSILSSRFPRGASGWLPPLTVTQGATSDPDLHLATDGLGGWMLVFRSFGEFGADRDILMSQSVDNAQTWTTRAPVDPAADRDSEPDSYASLATNGGGTWVAAWHKTGMRDRLQVAVARCE